MGMTVLDVIEYPGFPPNHPNLGGDGLWATFGARLFKDGDKSRQVGCLVVTGESYPDELFQMLESWNTTTVIPYRNHEPINTVHLVYKAAGSLWRTLSFQDPPLKPTVRDMRDTILITAYSFHLACVPCEAARQVQFILKRREHYGITEPPFFVWQARYIKALSLNPNDEDWKSADDQLNKYLAVLDQVDVFSVNIQDLSEIVGSDDEWFLDEKFVRRGVEMVLGLLPNLSVGPSGNGVLLVRCEPFGYYWRQGAEAGWVRSYNRYRRGSLVDFTGGGSSFLGAFTIAFLEGCSVRESCIRGAAAASFAMQQLGFPSLGPGPWCELWNNTMASDRVRAIRMGQED
ncbi:Ribokinase-like protein [Xylaria cf. heliscus]|nr:Ribokinase-like protein [Xylaria cf. heliscus]